VFSKRFPFIPEERGVVQVSLYKEVVIFREKIERKNVINNTDVPSASAQMIVIMKLVARSRTVFTFRSNTYFFNSFNG
jgi:hypothetical protein